MLPAVSSPDRRTCLQLGAGLCAALFANVDRLLAFDAHPFRLATFEVDVTPPLGHPLIAGLRPPAKSIADRLLARGLILLSDDKPVVIVTLDWCELRNEAYDQMRDAVATAAGAARERVVLTCNHQHDAPYIDLTAQALLAAAGLPEAMFQAKFWDQTVSSIAIAVRAALPTATPITHLGLGEATVERVACNRRVVAADGKPKFNRYSFTADKYLLDAPEGIIDPVLRTIAFYREDTPLASLSVYATHPMSYYGRGEVSGDFPGLARDLWQRQHKAVFSLYATGCSGDVVAAKYNDGTPAGRAQLAEQLKKGMDASWKSMRREPLRKIGFRNELLEIPPPVTGKLDPKRLAEIIADAKIAPATRIDAALGLSYHQRCERSPAIDVPLIDFGVAAYLALPAEMFVGFSLTAQELINQQSPGKLLLVAGFSECAPGYIPTAEARREGFAEEHGYCWVREDAPAAIEKVLKKLLLS